MMCKSNHHAVWLQLIQQCVSIILSKSEKNHKEEAVTQHPVLTTHIPSVDGKSWDVYVDKWYYKIPVMLYILLKTQVG